MSTPSPTLSAYGRRRPVVAGLLAFFVLAQAGIPPTAGFIAKLGVFDAAANANSYALLIVGVLTSVIAAYVYLRVIVTMYASEDEQDVDDEAELPAERSGLDMPTVAVLTVCVAATLWIGVLPSVVTEFARRASLLF